MYHALNRRVGRLPIFESDSDYAAFIQVLDEAYSKVPVRGAIKGVILVFFSGNQRGHSGFFLAYGYDALGRRHTMTTYKGGSGWSGSTWPTGNSAHAETTTWNFEAGTGLLLSKVYDDSSYRPRAKKCRFPGAFAKQSPWTMCCSLDFAMVFRAIRHGKQLRPVSRFLRTRDRNPAQAGAR